MAGAHSDVAEAEVEAIGFDASVLEDFEDSQAGISLQLRGRQTTNSDT